MKIKQNIRLESFLTFFLLGVIVIGVVFWLIYNRGNLGKKEKKDGSNTFEREENYKKLLEQSGFSDDADEQLKTVKYGDKVAKIAKAGSEYIFETDLKWKLGRSENLSEEERQTAIEELVEESKVLQTFFFAGFLELDKDMFNTPYKDYSKRKEQLSKAMFYTKEYIRNGKTAEIISIAFGEGKMEKKAAEKLLKDLRKKVLDKEFFPIQITKLNQEVKYNLRSYTQEKLDNRQTDGFPLLNYDDVYNFLKKGEEREISDIFEVGPKSLVNSYDYNNLIFVKIAKVSSQEEAQEASKKYFVLSNNGSYKEFFESVSLPKEFEEFKNSLEGEVY